MRNLDLFLQEFKIIENTPPTLASEVTSPNLGEEYFRLDTMRSIKSKERQRDSALAEENNEDIGHSLRSLLHPIVYL